jgi:APA family basic amino acid/polyamine antiporter
VIPQSAPPPSDGTTSSTGSPGLARELTAKDGFAIVAGSVIGSGIFLVPGTIANHLVSLPAVLAIWFLGGMLSLFGALSLAELGSMFPAAGGLYVYLRNAYGRPIAFLYGWGLVIMIQTGTIATLAAGFSLYLSQMVSISPWQQKLLAIASILALTGFNLMSLRKAKQLQNAGNAAKLLGLALLGAFLFWRGHAAVLHMNWAMPTRLGLLPYGVALIAVLWAYEGWHVVSFTASEFRAPQRDLPRSLVSGTLIVAAIYLVINLAYYSVLNAHSIAGMPSAAAGAVQRAYGSGVVWLVSLLILVSILGAMNGMILTGPRVYYAMARDRMFFRFLARTTERSRVPVAAILVQGFWAAALVLTGNFQQLFTSVIFTAWIFYGLAVAGVIVLRIRYPQQPRPFRTPGYPLLPLLFVIAAGAVVWSTIATMPGHAAIGIFAILAGLPLFFLFRSRLERDQSESPVTKIEQ